MKSILRRLSGLASLAVFLPMALAAEESKPAAAPELPDPVAVVEGEKISRADLEKTFDGALTSSGINSNDLTADQKMAGYREILDELIVDKLVSRKASSVEIPDAEVDADIDKVFGIFPRLKERARQLAGTMSGGEQQMLAMGRALMARPKVLLMDEPSMGLSPIMVDKIFEVVADIHSRGTTVLLVEQNASRALGLADRGYVMDSGEITMSGEAKTLLNDPKVRAAYLGE